MTNNQLDIIICIMPKINPEAPTVGPSVLKAHLASAGFTCKVIDLNIKYTEYKSPPDMSTQL